MLALGVALCGNGLAAQQSDAAVTDPAKVSFQFERASATVPHFTLTVDEEGKTSYTADLPVSPIATRGGTGSGAAGAMQHIEKTVVLTPATTAKIFELARSLDRFNLSCESTAKNVADMGKKTLRYTGSGGDGACVYNYSSDRRVTELTAILQGIGTTLDFGRRLDFEHRFDRLALDQETQDLVESVDDGRATELNVIARTLRSIAQDTAVLERVRGRAASLLQRFPPVE
jgi:hypothetical protein